MKRFLIKYLGNRIFETSSPAEAIEQLNYARRIDANAELYEAHYLQINPEELEAKIK